MRLTFRAMLFLLFSLLYCVLCCLKTSSLERSWHIIKSDRQRYGCVEAHQHRDIGDPGMTEYLHRAIVENLGNPTRRSERGSHLEDHLLSFIYQRVRQHANR